MASDVPDKTDSQVRRDVTVNHQLRLILPFLEDAGVTEVAINQPGQLFTRRFEGWVEHEVPELTAQMLMALSVALAVYNNKKLEPILSVILPGGQRGQIVMPPACLEGMIGINIRKHSSVIRTIEELEQYGAFDGARDASFNRPDQPTAESYLEKHDFSRLEPHEVELLRLKREKKWADFLTLAVQSKRNIIIAGKTGSGKTTVARSLIEKVPHHERILTIEDVHELILDNHRNRLHMMFGDGEGRVSAQACLAANMRQSPDRIFLAELRSQEAWDYLNSLNTGHPGSISTTHANNAISTFSRVASLIKQSEIGRTLEWDLIMREIYSTLDIVIFFHERKMLEIFYDPIFAKKYATAGGD